MNLLKYSSLSASPGETQVYKGPFFFFFVLYKLSIVISSMAAISAILHPCLPICLIHNPTKKEYKQISNSISDSIFLIQVNLL